MARNFSTEAIVLRRTNTGEADRVIVFLSKYRGKFTAIAKGVRKISSRRGPNLELFNRVKAYFIESHSLPIVSEVETIETFKRVKVNLEQIGSSFYLAEVTDKFLEEGQGDGQVFELLTNSLRYIGEDVDREKTRKALRAYEIKLLGLTGFQPSLSSCVVCRKDISYTDVGISPQFGGATHPLCLRNDFFSKRLSKESFKALRFLQREGWGKIKRLILSKQINTELETASRFYLEYLLEKEIKSSLFLDDIASFSKAA